ncbi:unnamed protein product [Schistosoma rodhaini]|uniref:DUF155 domain-containing protein n=2 Tax=Schistosoma rodhaini TaxID=6188 RepID=A0AA85FTF4_9TREM|nr:unnamed protein product [Schistosoma rodhaini]
MIKCNKLMFICKVPNLMKTFSTNNSSILLPIGSVRCYSIPISIRTNSTTIKTYSSSRLIYRNLSFTATLFQPTSSSLTSIKLKDHQTNLSLGLFHPKKKRVDKEIADLKQSGFYDIAGYGFAQCTDLKMLRSYLSKFDNLYKFPTLPSELSSEVLLISQLFEINTENNNPWDAFIFNNGVAVFWNMPEENHQSLLKEFRQFSEGILEENLIEREGLRYCLTNDQTRVVGEDIYLHIPSLKDVSHHTEQQRQQSYKDLTLEDQFSKLASASLTEDNSLLEKFAFSDALALSENGFDTAVVEIEPWIEKMKTGRGARFRQSAVLRKTGELYTIKHLLNVSTSLIETPDFYWERPDVEKLFEKLKYVLSVSSRIKVLNSRLDMCNELTSILTNHLCSVHSVRLEWMVIILIFVEVIFEAVNYYDKSGKH